MSYDCLIVGGGPAGAMCACRLQEAGLRCLILEKRTEMDEKICGGFLPNRGRLTLMENGIDLSSIADSYQVIKGYREFRGKNERVYTYPQEHWGIGILRRRLDSFLLEEAKRRGAEVRMGEPVYDYSCQDNTYCVNGEQAGHLIWAAGVLTVGELQCVDKKKAARKMREQTMGISEIISVAEPECGTQGEFGLDEEKVHFWYEEENDDYFWAIPVAEHTWNIGYWTGHSKTGLKEKFLRGRALHLSRNFGQIQSIRRPLGAFPGNVDLSSCFTKPASGFCGDIAGANNRKTGEGITQALQSAVQAAERILR